MATPSTPDINLVSSSSLETKSVDMPASGTLSLPTELQAMICAKLDGADQVALGLTGRALLAASSLERHKTLAITDQRVKYLGPERQDLGFPYTVTKLIIDLWKEDTRPIDTRATTHEPAFGALGDAKSGLTVNLKCVQDVVLTFDTWRMMCQYDGEGPEPVSSLISGMPVLKRLWLDRLDQDGSEIGETCGLLRPASLNKLKALEEIVFRFTGHTDYLSALRSRTAPNNLVHSPFIFGSPGGHPRAPLSEDLPGLHTI